MPPGQRRKAELTLHAPSLGRASLRGMGCALPSRLTSFFPFGDYP